MRNSLLNIISKCRNCLNQSSELQIASSSVPCNPISNRPLPTTFDYYRPTPDNLSSNISFDYNTALSPASHSRDQTMTATLTARYTPTLQTPYDGRLKYCVLHTQRSSHHHYHTSSSILSVTNHDAGSFRPICYFRSRFE